MNQHQLDLKNFWYKQEWYKQNAYVVLWTIILSITIANPFVEQNWTCRCKELFINFWICNDVSNIHIEIPLGTPETRHGCHRVHHRLRFAVGHGHRSRPDVLYYSWWDQNSYFWEINVGNASYIDIHAAHAALRTARTSVRFILDLLLRFVNGQVLVDRCQGCERESNYLVTQFPSFVDMKQLFDL